MARRRSALNFGSMIKRMAKQIEAYATQKRLDDYGRGEISIKDQYEWAKTKLSTAFGTESLRWERYLDNIKKDATEDKLSNSLSRGEITPGEVAGWLRKNRLADMDKDSPVYDDYLTAIESLDKKQSSLERRMYRSQMMLKYAQTKDIGVKIDMFSKLADEAYNDYTKSGEMEDYLDYIQMVTSLQNAYNTRDGSGSGGGGGTGKESGDFYNIIQDTEDKLQDLARGGLHYSETSGEEGYTKTYERYVAILEAALQKPSDFWSENKIRTITDKYQDVFEGTATIHKNYITSANYDYKTGYNPLRDGIRLEGTDEEGNPLMAYNDYEEVSPGVYRFTGKKRVTYRDKYGIVKSKLVEEDWAQIDEKTGEITGFDIPGVFIDPLTYDELEEYTSNYENLDMLPDDVKELGGYKVNKDKSIDVSYTFNPDEPLEEGQEITRFAINPRTGIVSNTDYWAKIALATKGQAATGLFGWSLKGSGNLKSKKWEFDPQGYDSPETKNLINVHAKAQVEFKKRTEPGYALTNKTDEQLMNEETAKIAKDSYARGLGYKVEFEKTHPEEYVAGRKPQVMEEGKPSLGLEKIIPVEKMVGEQISKGEALGVKEAKPSAQVTQPKVGTRATGYKIESPGEGQYNVVPSGTAPTTRGRGIPGSFIDVTQALGEKRQLLTKATSMAERYKADKALKQFEAERKVIQKRLQRIQTIAKKTPTGSWERHYAKGLKKSQYSPKTGKYIPPKRSIRDYMPW